MLAARDPAVMSAWASRKPVIGPSNLVIRSVKSFYDGAMGSRGAFFFEDYSDRPSIAAPAAKTTGLIATAWPR